MSHPAVWCQLQWRLYLCPWWWPGQPSHCCPHQTLLYKTPSAAAVPFFPAIVKPDSRTRQIDQGGLNIKMPSYQYRDSHVKDTTVSPTVLSLTWESPYLGKTVFILRRGPGFCQPHVPCCPASLTGWFNKETGSETGALENSWVCHVCGEVEMHCDCESENLGHDSLPSRGYRPLLPKATRSQRF